MNIFKTSRLDGLALLAGILLPFAFAPYYFSLIGFFSPAFLLLIWNKSPRSHVFKQGLFFGLGFFSIGVSWVYVSVHVFGQAPVPLALLITVLFIGFLALFFATMGYLLSRCCSSNSLLKNLIAFPCLWVIFELLRTWLFSGFPWLLLGYSQTDTGLRGFAPLVGVYGLSYITAFISGVLVSCYQYRKRRLRLMLATGVILIGLLGDQLSKIRWTDPVGTPLKVTMVQGNVAQQIKWQPEQIAKTLNLYRQLTQENWASNLIIWPEAAVTLPLQMAGDFIHELNDAAKLHHSTVITGIPVIKSQIAYNAMIALGNGSGFYYKRHLVPFGEYIPLRPIFQFLAQGMQIPMSDVTPGPKKQAPLIANGIFIAPYICYEVAYPLEFLTFLPKAQLLLTITDDSWFGHSIAAAQHLQMAQMRALETGRYLLFSSNTGITAVIDPLGKVAETVPSFEQTTLTATVSPMEGDTPWMILKLYPVVLLLLLSLVWIGLDGRRR